MHKSKNYDMATQVAMDKLMPKPIQISISMKGGGGLSSINKPISINGKRHNLAWINSDEASALKAMGGSGKKVDGIPAYFYIGENESYEDVIVGPSGDSPTEESYMLGTSQQADPNQVDPNKDPTYPKAQNLGSRGDGSDDDEGSSYQDLYDRSELNSLKTQLIGRLGGPGMEAYMKGLGKEGLATVIDRFHTGWDFGGAVGTAEGISRGIGESYSEKLDLKKLSKELKELKERNLPDEEFEEAKGEIFSRYQGIAKNLKGELTEQKDFKGMYGDFPETLERAGLKDTLAGTALDYLKPGSMLDKIITGGLNALTSMAGVIGEFTTEAGKTFRVMKDGSLVEEDLPPDPSTMDSGTVEVDETVGSVVAPRPIEVAEKKKVGLSDIFDQESKRPASNVHLSALLDAIYGEGQGQEMLG